MTTRKDPTAKIDKEPVNLSREAAAEKLGIHPQTLWLLLKFNHVRGVRLGRRWQVSQEEVNRCKREGYPPLIRKAQGATAGEH